VESLTPQLTNSGQTLLSRLSFTHFAELLEIQDSLKRVFYEVECIRGNWSVRELERQIATRYCERTGLSKKSGIGFKPVLKRNGLFVFSLTIEDYRRRKK